MSVRLSCTTKRVQPHSASWLGQAVHTRNITELYRWRGSKPHWATGLCSSSKTGRTSVIFQTNNRTTKNWKTQNCSSLPTLSAGNVIALSHIHVSAAYRSRIYENVNTPRSEPYFARATYVPRMCDVPATFPWRIRDVSELVWNFTFVCTAYQGVCATYVWRMYGLWSVRVTNIRRMYYVPLLSAAYLLCTNCFLIPMRTNDCVHFVHAVRIL